MASLNYSIGRSLAAGLCTTTLLVGCTLTSGPEGNGWVPPQEPTASGSTPPPTGAIMWERFDGVAEGSVEEIRDSSLVAGAPVERYLMSNLELPRNLYDNYTIRMRGYLRPQVSDSYRLYIRGSNIGAVWLSTDENPANATLKAYFPTSQISNGWLRVPSQQSEPVYLEAGKSYYLEAVQTNGTGSDWFALAWAQADADSSTAKVLKGDVLAPLLPTEISPQDLEPAFKEGYRTGYTDGRYGYPVNMSYPAKDSDGDGLPDNWELAMGLDPANDADALTDNDGDGLYALLEWQYLGDANKADSDGDGIPDGWEISNNLSITDPADALLVNAAGVAYLAQYRNEAGLGPILKAGEVLVEWSAPTALENGTELDATTLAGYDVLYGVSAESLTEKIHLDDPAATSIVLSGLAPGVVYVSVVAYDNKGRMSDGSVPIALKVTE